MPVRITRAHLRGARSRALGFARRLGAHRDKADKAVEVLVSAAEVGGASFSLGLIQGRYGGVEIVGVPLDLGAAIVLHGLAFIGVGGKLSHHLHNFGDGALATYLATLGRGAGVEMRKKALGAAVTGVDGARLTDQELAALAM